MTIRLHSLALKQGRAISRMARTALIALCASGGASFVFTVPAYADAQQAVARLADGRWELVEIQGAGRFPRHPADVFEFDGKGMSGRVGCNWVSAAAEFSDGVVKYSDAKQTTMGCRTKNDPFGSGRLQAVGAALEGARVERATSTRAEIVSSDGKTTLVFHRLKH